MEAEKLLYPVDEAAKLLSMGVRTLWARIKSKDLRSRKIGKRIYIHRDELSRFAKGPRK